MTHDTTTQSSDRLDQIIAEYLAAEEAGDPPSPEELIAAYPDLAEELRRFFTNREELGDVLPGEPPRRQFVPPKIRYFGDYELIDEIARGGMGVVYRAKQTRLNRIVAVKMILEGEPIKARPVGRIMAVGWCVGVRERKRVQCPVLSVQCGHRGDGEQRNAV